MTSSFRDRDPANGSTSTSADLPPNSPPNYDPVAAKYDCAHGTRRNQIRFARIEAPLLKATVGCQRVLEIGVGTGRLLSQVSASTRVGMDVSAEMLTIARESHPQLYLVRANGESLPFASHSFDAIIAGKGVFRYLNLTRALAECRRVLRPRGQLAFHQYSATTWSLRTLINPRADKRWRHLHVENPAELERALVRAGFVLKTVRLFRSIRFYPYAIEIPRRFAGRWWSHISIVAINTHRSPNRSSRYIEHQNPEQQPTESGQ